MKTTTTNTSIIVERPLAPTRATVEARSHKTRSLGHVPWFTIDTRRTDKTGTNPRVKCMHIYLSHTHNNNGGLGSICCMQMILRIYYNRIYIVICWVREFFQRKAEKLPGLLEGHDLTLPAGQGRKYSNCHGSDRVGSPVRPRPGSGYRREVFKAPTDRVGGPPLLLHDRTRPDPIRSDP